MHPNVDEPVAAVQPVNDDVALTILEEHLEQARDEWNRERDRQQRLLKNLGISERNIASWERTIRNLQVAIGRLHAH